MVEVDVGDDAGQWRHDVGRVKSAAQPSLPDYELAILYGEVTQGHDSDDFDKRWRCIARKNFQHRLHLKDQPDDIRTLVPAVLEAAILKKEVLPSMSAMMTAGPAL